MNKVPNGPKLEDITTIEWMAPLSAEIKSKEHKIFGWKEISRDELEPFDVDKILGSGSYGVGKSFLYFSQILNFLFYYIDRTIFGHHISCLLKNLSQVILSNN